MTKSDFKKGQRVKYTGNVLVYDGSVLVAVPGDEGVVENIDMHPIIAGPTVRWDVSQRIYDLHPDELMPL